MNAIPTINDRWKYFESKILDPINAGPTQRQEMKRAFFSGANEVLDIMTREITELSDEDGVKEISRLYRQLEGFGEAIKLGVA